MPCGQMLSPVEPVNLPGAALSSSFQLWWEVLEAMLEHDFLHTTTFDVYFVHYFSTIVVLNYQRVVSPTLAV